ncbi:PepSY domain-containing protein [Saccharophagus sp. K07]|jgi:uncharacterized membrane protein YkoI|uniref:PepSY domain-containing protein n=1 Tax=Saccharophagus sp. K07 TaxID=2283636 RepID=UPI001CA38652|nr:PepSY domain-containing protein [Saccharophagus sp. K07]
MMISTTKRRLASFLLSLAVMPVFSWAAPKHMRESMPYAQGPRQYTQGPMQYAQGQGRTDKSKAADIARSAHGGRVLTVEEVNSDGKTIYRVKLLLDGGRIKIVTVDGNSGRII